MVSSIESIESLRFSIDIVSAPSISQALADSMNSESKTAARLHPLSQQSVVNTS